MHEWVVKYTHILPDLQCSFEAVYSFVILVTEVEEYT
jgi:hypothetical protein